MNKNIKRLLAVFACVLIVGCMAVPAFATSGTDYADQAVSAVQAGLGEITGTISIGNIFTVLAAVIGIAIGFVFFWWALRKVIRIVMGAFRKGKVSV